VWWIPYSHLPWPGVAIAIIAVLAALMSIHARIRPLDKFVYLILIAGLLTVEFRAMYKDRKDAQEAQNRFEMQEDQRLKEMLENEQAQTKILLDQENQNFSAILLQDQNQFTKTMSALLSTHKQDEKDFAGIVQKEEGLIEAQRELSEQFNGRLVPGNGPTPHNSCLPDGQEPTDGQILIVFGDNADIEEKLPHDILEIGDFPMIAIDRVENSDAIALSLDFRDNQNRIALRIDKNGAVNRTALILLHPDKSTFLIQDSFGQEMLRATYVNRKVFEINGKAIYCGKIFDLQPSFLHHSCAMNSGKTGYRITAPKCSMPPQ